MMLALFSCREDPKEAGGTRGQPTITAIPREDILNSGEDVFQMCDHMAQMSAPREAFFGGTVY